LSAHKFGRLAGLRLRAWRRLVFPNARIAEQLVSELKEKARDSRGLE
jgi:hypothetical protein